MFQDNLFRELVVDNFAGGGGASTGMELALGYPVDIAVNHDADAIAMHKVNHPYTRHFQEDVFAIDPERVTGGRAVGIAWFSPDCKHFSRAKGGKPVDKKIRGLSWAVLRWAMSSVAPRVIFMENVPEIKTWCPLIEIDGQMRPDPAREGETFNGFVAMLTGGIEKEHPAFLEACEFLKIEPDSEDGDRLAAGLGYAVSWKEMKACDYGAPTIHNRFYLIARRDGQPIVFPEPTHGKGRKPYRTAAECIDWSLPCPSIFGRKKELAENTLRRIARGLDKFVLRNASPYIMCNNTNNVPHGVNEPLPTQTTGNRNYLCAPSLVQYHYYYGGADHASRVDSPLPTVTTLPRHYIVKTYLQKIDAAQDFGNWAHVREILNKYAGYSIAADEIFIVEIDGERYFISDIGMRMLKARELMLAQGFPPDYIIDIESHIGKRYSEAKQIARMGNAVCPPVAEALVRANCAEIASQRVIATMAMLNAVIDESCHRKRQYRRAAQ